ncbi:Uncharacterized protein TCM_044736 [Theobroma cacao]|uniref:Uncharacterized protein n=1 Tax=Theobroma cacao TaxID=3641 RepID=A0A061FXR3_THECC|nr:Uncharacterized protein TCM_044736 [Theobroma cacao]
MLYICYCFQVEVHVERLNVLKASKMKELVFKRQNELEEIYRGVHMDVNSDAARQLLINLLESGSAKLSPCSGLSISSTFLSIIIALQNLVMKSFFAVNILNKSATMICPICFQAWMMRLQKPNRKL